MNNLCLQSVPITVGAATLVAATMTLATAYAAPPSPSLVVEWTTVVNNTDLMPTDDERCLQPPPQGKETPRRCFFNSYNQPSVNVNGLVVIRARSRGGGGGEGGGGGGEGSGGENQPIHGIYTRDMGMAGGPGDIVRILDRTVEVPQPNNIRRPPENSPNIGPLTTFIETPSFPRIDMSSDTIATRGNHQPVWKVFDRDTDDEILEQVGTTGIYTNPFGDLITGASKLGGETERVGEDPVQEFPFFEVPEAPGTPFDVFPGAPAVTDGATIVFKGNYTVDSVGKTGVYYRHLTADPIQLEDDSRLEPAGGMNPVVLIANNTETLIPNTSTVFGSTSPPSAAMGPENRSLAVFAGFDNEENPTLGGIYLAELAETRELEELVSIGDRVPGENPQARFSRLGEGVAFDGRYVAFWGAWGPASRTIRLHCPTEGNKDRVAFCLTQCPEPEGCATKLPVRQGIFLHDTLTGETRAVAKAPNDFEDFVFWNFSGKVPGIGGGDEGGEDDGEPARWRSSAFIAVSGPYTAFKAVTGNRIGVYLSSQPGRQAVTVIDNRSDGQLVDPEAPAGSVVTEVGLEREGLRGDWLTVSAKMAVAGGTEEDGMAGVYITQLPPQ
jgi:hypothetical protein